MLRRAAAPKVGIVRWVLGALVAAVLLPSQAAAQTQLTVGAGGTYTDIQTAINACPKNGCEVILTDSVYALPREIWIEGMMNLTIRRSPDLERRGIQPRLYYGTAANQATLWTGFAGTGANPNIADKPLGWKSWPLNDGTGAGGAKNTTNQWSTSGFQFNGYIVIYKADYITIDGIKVDGQKPTYLLNKSIWPETAGGAGKYAVFFGNVGINLMQAYRVNLVNSQIVNCFTAIYMNGRNPGGAFGAENPGDLDGSKIIPYAAFGRVGNHTIEKNTFATNWWAFFNESEWDLGSTIRYNISYSNYNPSYSTIKGLDTEGANMFGGFMYIKDVVLVPHKIYNNTLYDNAMVLGYGGWRGGIQHYFFNNIVAAPHYLMGSGTTQENVWNDFRNLMQKYSTFLYNNTFEFPASWGGTQQASVQLKGPDTLVDGTNSHYCNQAWCDLNNGPKVTIFNNVQVNGWTLEKARNADPATWFPFTYNGKADTGRVGQQEYYDSMGLVLAVQRIGATSGADSIRSHQNHWTLGLPFKSTRLGTAGFMEPMWDTKKVDSLVEDKGWVNSGRDPDGSLPDRGAISRSKGTAKNTAVIYDQTMVSIINGTTVKFNFGIDATGLTDLKWEKLDYYPHVSYVMRGGTAGKPTDLPDRSFPTPRNMTVTSGAPKDGQNSFAATLPVAPSDSFARFEITFSGIPAGGTERVVSNIGVWVWRKAEYALDVQFLDPTTLKPITAARVGQPVKLAVKVLKTSNGTYPDKAALDSLIISLGSVMMKGVPPGGDTTKSGEVFDPKLPTGQRTYDVYFTRVEAVRTIDLNLRGSYGAVPVIGSASLRLRSGPPEKALFVNPMRLSSNRKSPVVVNQIATEFELKLYDAFDNPVDDTAVTVELSSELNMATLPAWVHNPALPLGLNGAIARWSALAAGPWTQPKGAVTTDSIGYTVAYPYHYVTGNKGARYLATANVKGKTFMDTAWIEIGDPLEQVYITPAVSFDTVVRTRMPVTVIVSKDGLVPFTTSDYAGGVVRLSTKTGSKYFKYFATSAATDTIAIDSVKLVGSKATVWVSVLDMPMLRVVDTLSAEMPELFAPTPGYSGTVAFNRPPVPPNPVIDYARTRDIDCDGVADSLVIKLKSPDGTNPGKLSSKVVLDSVRLVSAAGAVTAIGGGWTVPATDSSVIRIPVTAAQAAALVGSNVTLTLNLINPPLADTTVHTAGVVADGIGPRLIGNAILRENFQRPTVPDTLQVTFSEPIAGYASTAGWVLAVTNNGVPVSTAGLVVSAVVPGDIANTYKIVFTGNTSGAVVAGGFHVRLLAVPGVTDVAGNMAGGAECGAGVKVVELPVPVPVEATWLKDANGDGRADRIYVRYVKPPTRKMNRNDLPDSVSVTWGAQTIRIAGSALITNNDSLVWEAAVGPFAYGVTIGTGNGGTGEATGTKSGAPLWSATMNDSVSPILTKASILFGNGIDTLVVTSSEPLKVVVGSNWVVKKVLAGSTPTGASGVPTSDATRMVWKIPMDPASTGFVSVGDSVRLPGAGSQFIADNSGTAPSSSDEQPWVAAIGADRAPSAAWYLDKNADGIVDAAGLEFAAPLKTSPSFVFNLGGAATVKIDSTNGLVIAPDRKSATVVFLASPFTAIKTDIVPATDYGTMTSVVEDMTVSARFSIRDSVAPVILSALLTYASYSDAAHQNDTLKLKLSEPVTLTDPANARNIIWGVSPSNAKEILHIQPGVIQVAPDFLLVLFDTSKAYTQLYNGDSVRIAPIDAAGEMTDRNGNAPTLALAKWTRIQAAPRPPRFDVGIFPKPVMVIDPAINPDNPVLSQGPQISVWVGSTGMDANGKFYPIKGSSVEGGSGINRESVIGNAIGPKFTVNGPFEATAIIYDNIGTYVGQTTIKVDTNMIMSDVVKYDSTGAPLMGKFAGKDGSFEIAILWNGKNESGKYVGSGVYMFRVVVYQNRVTLDGRKTNVMVMNQVTKVGVKAKTK